MKRMVRDGFTYKLILYHLKKNFNEDISQGTLSNVMHGHGIFKSQHVDDEVMDRVVADETKYEGAHLGYRLLTLKLRKKYDLNFTRDAVAASQKRLPVSHERELSKIVNW